LVHPFKRWNHMTVDVRQAGVIAMNNTPPGPPVNYSSQVSLVGTCSRSVAGPSWRLLSYTDRRGPIFVSGYTIIFVGIWECLHNAWRSGVFFRRFFSSSVIKNHSMFFRGSNIEPALISDLLSLKVCILLLPKLHLSPTLSLSIFSYYKYTILLYILLFNNNIIYLNNIREREKE